jgi:hypothetical protein
MGTAARMTQFSGLHLAKSLCSSETKRLRRSKVRARSNARRYSVGHAHKIEHDRRSLARTPCLQARAG